MVQRWRIGFRWRLRVVANVPQKEEHVCGDDVLASAMYSVAGPGPRYNIRRARYRDDIVEPAVLAMLKRGPAHSCAVADALREQGDGWSGELDGFVLAALWRALDEGLVAISPISTGHSGLSGHIYELTGAGPNCEATPLDSGS